MGRSRGGLTTKIHALVDADGLPVRLELTAGQAADAPMAEKLLSDLQPGATILADKAYDTDAIRNFAKQRKCWANIPQRPIESRHSASAAGSTVSAISWNGSSTVSNRCAASRRDTTDVPTTISPLSNLQRRGYGSHQLMSPRPRKHDVTEPSFQCRQSTYQPGADIPPG